MELKGFQILL